MSDGARVRAGHERAELTAAPSRRIDKLQYNSQFRKAILQVFGKTVIVRSLELGPQIARTHGLNAITLDGSQLAETPAARAALTCGAAGDQVNKRGALTGGYIDSRQSRITAQKELKVQARARARPRRASGRMTGAADPARAACGAGEGEGQEAEDHAAARSGGHQGAAGGAVVAAGGGVGRDGCAQAMGEIQKWSARKEALRRELEVIADDLDTIAKNRELADKSVKQHVRRRARCPPGALGPLCRGAGEEHPSAADGHAPV